ncbi:hypothetical protein MKK75_26670 [Methylobacterium sp. J-030]|uniref:hypothetical protein n=1 Tax=Methylobacterium sp. J-030 TaxID=2836627 RepID=UPI001FBBEFD3|nr:hypothetical protein [Methylobacterium sp. J-030]MCJ2072332.1 hypothetical protein [Methylobacterium sp. J-030]
MSDIQSFRGDAYPRAADLIGSDRDAVSGERFNTRLRIVPSPEARTPVSQTAPALPDWSGLVDLVHAAARHLHRTQAQAQDQDRASGQALRRARDAVVAAERQARQAESLADAVRRRAEDRVAAAERRVAAAEAHALAAEGRARESEAWLGRVQATILSAFPEPNDQAAA